jgi:AcrR family transcriptional regulator
MPSLAPVLTRQRRKESRPQELLDAALSLFVEKGFAATRSEEVAQRAGVSKGTLYLYFHSKEELLKAVVRHTLAAEIAAGAEQIDRFAGNSTEAVTDLLSDWWARMYDSPASGVFKLMITEMRNFPDISAFYASEVMEPGQALIGRVLERGIARGEFRPVDVPSAVQSIILPMVMLCLHKHSLSACSQELTASEDPKHFIRQHFTLLMGGLRAASDSSLPAAPPRIRRKSSPKLTA